MKDRMRAVFDRLMKEQAGRATARNAKNVRMNIIRFALTIGLAMILLPAGGFAAEIKLMCPAPMRTTIVELVAQFERSSPHKVEIVHTPSSFIVKRVRSGEEVDVTILTTPTSDELIKEGKLTRRVGIARSSIGVAVLTGAPKPDVSSADAVKRTLLAVKTFARNEGAESGMHMLRVFERLGIVDEMKAKTIAMPVNTGYVAQLVADGKVEMAAQQMPELYAVSGVAPTPLPAELQMIIPFSAGVSSTTRQGEAVEALLTFLTSPAAAAVLKSKGLDPP
jgi:molybdate transport system substrate-binding protein